MKANGTGAQVVKTPDNTAAAGEGGDPTAIVTYVSEVVSAVHDADPELDEEQTIEMFLDFLDALADEGMVDPAPFEGTPDEQEAWIAAAETAGVVGLFLETIGMEEVEEREDTEADQGQDISSGPTIEPEIPPTP
jgi:hypothetical protein